MFSVIINITVGPAIVLCMYFQTLIFHTSTATQCTVAIISHHINSPEALNLKIVLAVVVVWVLVCVCMISGIVCCGKLNRYRLLHIYIYTPFSYLVQALSDGSVFTHYHYSQCNNSEERSSLMFILFCVPVVTWFLALCSTVLINL